MGMTRRTFLTSAGLTMLELGHCPPFFGRLASAAPGDESETVLVSIFLRGGMDGLMAVPPIDAPHLNQMRPSLALDRSGGRGEAQVDLDGRFGLHPALEPLLPYWSDQRLAIVHGVGSPSSNRSHFDAQDFMETGTPDVKGTSSGWLNRTVELMGASSRSPLEAVALSETVPRSFAGPLPTVATADLARLSLSANAASIKDIERIWSASTKDSLVDSGTRAFEVLRLLDRKALDSYRSRRKASYPKSALGQRLMQIAFLIKQNVGLRIAFANSPGWDTHASQSVSFTRAAADLASSMSAFWEDIEPYQHSVVVLTMTEFGRTVAQNGAGGTDHGHGSCWFALGDRVDGGRVYGEPPSLSPADLFEGRDLPVTTDFRSVFAEVSGKLFGINADEIVFPRWSGPRSQILR